MEKPCFPARMEYDMIEENSDKRTKNESDKEKMENKIIVIKEELWKTKK